MLRQLPLPAGTKDQVRVRSTRDQVAIQGLGTGRDSNLLQKTPSYAMIDRRRAASWGKRQSSRSEFVLAGAHGQVPTFRPPRAFLPRLWGPKTLLEPGSSFRVWCVQARGIFHQPGKWYGKATDACRGSEPDGNVEESV
ncbi:hypothetical protein VTN77DRAFT_926 [Rasamsonia byssochlamydoides]|uniref:uncharacterized protein n=1 Tax=Rasamsonia byssochlamydoides TaxID=89139 RepID=UPI0037432D5F